MIDPGFLLSNYNKYEFELISPKGNVGISTFKDISFNNVVHENKSETFVVNGKSFIVYINEYSFFHNMQDILGQFLLLKSKIPDLKIVPILYGGDHLRGNIDDIYLPPSIREMMQMLSVDLSATIRIEEYKSINFESIYFINAINNSFLNFALSKNIFQEMTGFIKDFSFEDAYVNLILKELKQFFRSKIKYEKTRNKIYITQNANKERLKYIQSVLDDFTANGVSWSESAIMDPLNYLSDKSKVLGWAIRDAFKLEQEIINRQMEKDSENTLINFFKNNGYEIVDTEGMTIMEQAAKFLSCSAIATNIGSNSFHSIFLEEDDTFILINGNLNYSFDHLYFVKKTVRDPICAFPPGQKDQSYSMESIFSYIKDKISNDV